MEKTSIKIPPAPAGLSEAAGGWWAALHTEWVLDPPACLLLENALRAFDRAEAARAMIEAEGAVVLDRFGAPKAHPATVIETQSRALMGRLLRQIGLDVEPLHAGPGRPPKGTF